MNTESLIFYGFFGLSFLGFIAMIVPTKSEKGERRQMIIFISLACLIWIILILGKISGVIPEAEGNWSELP